MINISEFLLAPLIVGLVLLLRHRPFLVRHILSHVVLEPPADALLHICGLDRGIVLVLAARAIQDLHNPTWDGDLDLGWIWELAAAAAEILGDGHENRGVVGLGAVLRRMHREIRRRLGIAQSRPILRPVPLLIRRLPLHDGAHIIGFDHLNHLRETEQHAAAWHTDLHLLAHDGSILCRRLHNSALELAALELAASELAIRRLNWLRRNWLRRNWRVGTCLGRNCYGMYEIGSN